MPTATYSPEPAPSENERSFSRGGADDHVYPVHILDGAKYQHCILTLYIRFNDILDAEKIRASLVKLLEIGDWRKLGGRFRTKGDKSVAPHGNGNEKKIAGKTLEIHVPKEFTPERPAIQFAYEGHELSIFDHALGQQLPQTSHDGVMLSPPLDDLRLCGHGPGFPTTMADLVDKDVPQLAFKVIGFTDATLLAITFSHCTWDISGLQGFMKSFELVLEGREDEVLPMLGGRGDILAEMVAQQQDGSCLDLGLLSLPEQANAAKEPRMPKDADLEERIIRVPLHIFERMRDLVARENPEQDQDALSMYQLDELFLGLIVRQIARAQSTPRDLQLLNIYNARLLVPQMANAEGIYSQNLVLLSPLPLSHEAATGPVGPIALAQRDNFAQAAVPQNITKSLCTVLGAIEADVDITALTDSGEDDAILVNNLVRLSNYIDVDLSAAVVRQGEKSQTRRNGLGTADLCFLTLPGSSYGMMRVTTLGSYNGNACWMFGELPGRAWALIYEALDELEL